MLLLAAISPVVRRLITKHLERLRGLNINLMLLYYYKKGDEVKELNFKMQNNVITEAIELTPLLSRSIERLIREMDKFQARGSGWTLARIKILKVRINKYNPLRGSSYIVVT